MRRTAKKDGFRFFGGVVLGRDVTRAELLERYHVVLYALGTSDDNRLGIPGEDRPGVHGATQFVGWYNGHPDAADLAGVPRRPLHRTAEGLQTRTSGLDRGDKI
jgi:NADPH-dependent glutamate synthase beta subunit-like oxidoreductase